MAAAAYTVSLMVATPRGNRVIRLTASDVNAAYWIFPSADTALPLSDGQATIIDTIYSAAGTDTSQVAIFANGVDTGFRIVNAANVGTVVGRQMQTARVSFAPGTIVKFQQLT